MTSSAKEQSRWPPAISSTGQAPCWSIRLDKESTGLHWSLASASISCLTSRSGIPARGKVYGVNEGNYHKWTTGTKKYVDYLKCQDKATGRPYSGRYSGCLVADVHRILLGEASISIPVSWTSRRASSGCCTEANPLAWVVEQAGGRASTGTMRILDVEAKQLHQRVPLIIGSANDVRDAEEFIQGRR